LSSSKVRLELEKKNIALFVEKLSLNNSLLTFNESLLTKTPFSQRKEKRKKEKKAEELLSVDKMQACTKNSYHFETT